MNRNMGEKLLEADKLMQKANKVCLALASLAAQQEKQHHASTRPLLTLRPSAVLVAQPAGLQAQTRLGGCSPTL